MLKFIYHGSWSLKRYSVEERDIKGPKYLIIVVETI